MIKATVTRLFIGSAIAATAGALLAIAAIWVAIANDVFAMSGPDIVGIQSSGLAWTLLGLGLVGAIAFMGGLIGGLVSWIGALLNTSQLDSKAWFVALLLLGIFNFGILAMIAYVIVGPDGTTTAVRKEALVSAAA
jgi:hypothetical protein